MYTFRRLWATINTPQLIATFIRPSRLIYYSSSLKIGAQTTSDASHPDEPPFTPEKPQNFRTSGEEHCTKSRRTLRCIHSSNSCCIQFFELHTVLRRTSRHHQHQQHSIATTITPLASTTHKHNTPNKIWNPTGKQHHRPWVALGDSARKHHP